ncbi:MAG: EutN/CcmL family microcompartment protein [Rhodothermales bacterium]
MNLGRVIGSVWATRKDERLEGRRMLVLTPLHFDGTPAGDYLIALDTADAGPGDLVIYASSSEAAIPFKPGLTPTDATIVGIVERVDEGGTTWYADGQHPAGAA